MFRPAPSYLVSSLNFNRSKRRLGSRFCATVFFPLALRVEGLVRGLGDKFAPGPGFVAKLAEGGMAVDAELDDPPNQLDNWKASSTTATTTSAAAAMTLLRFSAPSFTRYSSDTSRCGSPA